MTRSSDAVDLLFLSRVISLVANCWKIIVHSFGFLIRDTYVL